MGARSRSIIDAHLTGTITSRTNGVVTGIFPGPVYHLDRYMDDVVTESFREKIKKGAYVNNPCHYVKTLSYFEGSGDYQAIHKTNGNVLTSNGDACFSAVAADSVSPSQRYTALTLPIEWDSKSISAAKASALANVDSTPYSFAEDIAEWRETLTFLRNPLGSLKNLSNSFSRDVSGLMARRKALKRAKAVSDVYLTYRFALSPLIRTINNLVQAYNDNPKRPKRRSARGQGEVEYSNYADQQRGSAGNLLYWRVSIKASAKVKAVIGYEVSNPVMDWRFKYGLRFKDIPATLWAIFPMSFMYDRLLNVSVAIQGMTNLVDPSVSFLGASTTHRVSSESTYSYYRQVHSSYNTTISPDVQKTGTFDYTRLLWDPNGLDAIPPVTLGNLVSSTTKVADLLALITQRLK